MKYDFTSVLDRKGKDAIAVDLVREGGPYSVPREGFDVIPMWIADMNFPVCPTIQAAMIRRAQEPTFGYFEPRKEYFEKITGSIVCGNAYVKQHDNSFCG